MRVLIWLFTGFAAGWLARLLLRGRPRLGLLGDLIVGALGGALGGRLFRVLGVAATDSPAAQALVALCGAMLLLGIANLVYRTGAGSRHVMPSSARAVLSMAEDLDAQIRRLGGWERQVLAHLLRRERVARDASAEFEETLPLGQRVADQVASFGGSWAFIGLFLLMMVAWMLFNTETRARWDPYPFILLNLVLSCLAALQAPVIMMSQNRQAEKDRVQARADYEVNTKAEMEIMALSARLDVLKEDRAQMVSRQEQLFARVEALLARVEDSHAD